MRQIKKMAKRGLLDPEQEDPFSLFVASTDIRYCYYHDTHKVLGNTFGMCVLQVRPLKWLLLKSLCVPSLLLAVLSLQSLLLGCKPAGHSAVSARISKP